MTYRDTIDAIAEEQEVGDAAPLRSDRDAPAPPEFTPLEDRVIALARADGFASIGQPGLIGRLLGLVFGVRLRGRTLADPRLEALRQAVVIARHRHHLPDTHAARLQGHGFTPRQIAAIETRAVAA